MPASLRRHDAQRRVTVEILESEVRSMRRRIDIYDMSVRPQRTFAHFCHMSPVKTEHRDDTALASHIHVLAEASSASTSEFRPTSNDWETRIVRMSSTSNLLSPSHAMKASLACATMSKP